MSKDRAKPIEVSEAEREAVRQVVQTYADGVPLEGEAVVDYFALLEREGPIKVNFKMVDGEVVEVTVERASSSRR